MSYSTGTRSFLGEVMGWAFVAGMAVIAITHYDELKGVTADAFWIAVPEQAAGAEGETAGATGGEGEAEAAVSSGGSVHLKAGSNGHYHTEAEVNGRSIDVMVDTGATFVALTYEDAERAGIFLKDSDFTHRVSTANGVARVAPITLGRVSIGDITVRNVDAAVCERGKLATTLLGMSFLGKLDRFEMRSGVLVLEN